MANMLGGFALFWGLPHAATWIGGYDLNLTTAVFFSAIQIHHFFVDGVIWKLKNPRVLSPLLVNLDDLFKARPPALASRPGGAAGLMPTRASSRSLVMAMVALGLAVWGGAARWSRA